MGDEDRLRTVANHSLVIMASSNGWIRLVRAYRARCHADADGSQGEALSKIEDEP